MSNQFHEKCRHQLRSAKCYSDAKTIINYMKAQNIKLNRKDFLYLKSLAESEDEITDMIKCRTSF